MAKLVKDDILTFTDDVAQMVPVGTSLDYAGIELPPKFLWEDGSVLSRIEFFDLYNRITKDMGTVTITEANPGVVSLTGHGLITGDIVEFTTSGTLPTNIVANTNYYVIWINNDLFWLATSITNAEAGTKIITTGAVQSGVHRMRYCPHGISGASNFLLPDSQGAIFRGAGTNNTFKMADGSTFYFGSSQGQRMLDKLFGHRHSYSGVGGLIFNSSGTGFAVPGGSDDGAATLSITDPLTDGTHGAPRIGYENAPFTMTRKKIIKYLG